MKTKELLDIWRNLEYTNINKLEMDRPMPNYKPSIQISTPLREVKWEPPIKPINFQIASLTDADNPDIEFKAMPINIDSLKNVILANLTKQQMQELYEWLYDSQGCRKFK